MDRTLSPTIRVHSAANDRWFTARVLRPGDEYGSSAVTWGSSEPGVEFYDATYVNDPRFNLGLGQHTGAAYNVSTLVENHRGGGIMLMGGVPQWTLDAPAFGLVIQWLRNTVLAVH